MLHLNQSYKDEDYIRVSVEYNDAGVDRYNQKKLEWTVTGRLFRFLEKLIEKYGESCLVAWYRWDKDAEVGWHEFHAVKIAWRGWTKYLEKSGELFEGDVLPKDYILGKFPLSDDEKGELDEIMVAENVVPEHIDVEGHKEKYIASYGVSFNESSIKGTLVVPYICKLMLKEITEAYGCASKNIYADAFEYKEPYCDFRQVTEDELKVFVQTGMDSTGDRISSFFSALDPDEDLYPYKIDDDEDERDVKAFWHDNMNDQNDFYEDTFDELLKKEWK